MIDEIIIMMNWDNLRYFMAVAKQGSLSAAARHLNVSQATVWRKVFQLESELCTTLFEASRTGYRMTPCGLKLLPLAEQMAAAAEEVSSSLQNSSHLQGTVRLIAPDILVTHLTQNLVCPLRAEQPDLSIELVTSSPLAPLSSRDTDIGILANKSYSSQMTLLAQFTLPFALYGATNRFAHPLSLSELPEYPLIDFDDDNEHLAPTGWFKRAAKMERSFRSNNPLARKGAAIAGIGLALLPCVYVSEKDSLTKVIDEDVIGALNLFLYINKERQAFPNVSAVSQYLQIVLKQLLNH